MKLHVETSEKSLGVRRVIDELHNKYGNHSYDNSDIVVVHVTGRLEKNIRKVDNILANGKKVIIVQYAIRSTQKPSTKDWAKLWRKAEFVWSYYDIAYLCKQDGTKVDFKICKTPLGTRISAYPQNKEFVIATSGLDYLTESVKECIRAANDMKRRMFHVGPNLKIPNVIYSDGISDSELARHYAACEFTSGLRRIEGFEYPAIEGLICGARPIVFDRHHYRQWYGDFAEYIKEEPREEVYRSLVKLFKKGARPVSKDEIEEAKNLFNWETILKQFNQML